MNKPPNQAKVLINMVKVSLEDWRMVSDRIVDFHFFVKFHTSGPAIIFSFWTLTEYLMRQKRSSSSKRIHQHCECYSGRIMDGFWKNCRFSFFVKFHTSGPAIIFSFWTLTEYLTRQKRSSSSKRPHQYGECYSGRIKDGFL